MALRSETLFRRLRWAPRLGVGKPRKSSAGTAETRRMLIRRELFAETM